MHMEPNSIFESGSKVLKFETICQNHKYVQNNMPPTTLERKTIGMSKESMNEEKWVLTINKPQSSL